MKHKSVIALRRKKKYGLLMGPFFGIKSLKEAMDLVERNTIPYSPDEKKEHSRGCALSIKVSDNNSKNNQDEMESRLRSVLSISNGNTDYV